MSRVNKKLVKEPFTNDIGQVLQPGDRVLIFTSNRYRSTTRLGTYLGKIGYGVNCQVEKKMHWYFDKVTGKQVPYNYFDASYENPHRWASPEYKKKSEENRVLYQSLMDKVERKPIINLGTTTLKLNRVYKVAA